MDLWSQVLSTVGKRVNQQCFDTWFRPIIFAGCDKSALHLTVPTESFKRCLLENYSQVLEDAINEIIHAQIQLQVSVATVLSSQPNTSSSEPAEVSGPAFFLNPKYTFDTFVVGSSNQFARAAALAVAEQPSKAYNPLYIYGGVGLGKTHLMHAIGHSIKQRNGRLHLTYMSAERFMNELVNAIRYDQTFQFRHKYRNIDVLLMDDIQFLSGKERTQEEFFHTFNALYDAQKQIVITSDCPPRQIPSMEERLHSRFDWGLIADIQPPDLETKIAILKKKAERSGLNLPDSVLMYIAEGIQSNIRLLEGALIRLGARAELDGLDVSEIGVDYTREVLKHILSGGKPALSQELILRAVADHFLLKPSQLKSKSHKREIARPRQIAMYLCKQLTDASLPQIGKDFGDKHHTTVLHSVRKIEELKSTDADISAALHKINQSLH